ncbi:MAG: chromate transporter [Deltaproteobacteria bacterium]|nr:chromate transporter [Deltaproteobacteria bacterium]
MLQLILTFLKIGAFTFGGGMVMIPFIEQDAVNTYAWLTNREFVDAIAMGQITPGPIVISSVFIGYKVAGFLGAVLAMGAISLPTFFYSIAAAHQLHRLKTNLRVRAFLKGVGPAVVGMILAAGVTIARTSVVDLWTGILAIICLYALVRYKVDASLVVITAGVIGFFFLG